MRSFSSGKKTAESENKQNCGRKKKSKKRKIKTKEQDNSEQVESSSSTTEISLLTTKKPLISMNKSRLWRSRLNKKKKRSYTIKMRMANRTYRSLRKHRRLNKTINSDVQREMLNILILVLSFAKYLVYLLPKTGLIDILLQIGFSSLILIESVHNFSLGYYFITILYFIHSFCEFLFEHVGNLYF